MEWPWKASQYFHESTWGQENDDLAQLDLVLMNWPCRESCLENGNWSPAVLQAPNKYFICMIWGKKTGKAPTNDSVYKELTT